MKNLKSLLLVTALTSLVPVVASAQFAPSEVVISSPLDHNSANEYVFLSFVASNQTGTFNNALTEVNLIVSDGQTGFFPQSSVGGGICHPGVVNGQPGTYYETCGCYFDLTQVDTNVSNWDFKAIHRSKVGGTAITGYGRLEVLPNSGPERPPATLPMCPPVNASAPNLAPVAIAGPDVTGVGGTLVSMQASASWDPDGDPLTFTWTQTGGPTVALTNASTATPTFYLPSVTSATQLDFKVSARDPGGLTSYADDLSVNVTPTTNAPSCSPWNRDHVVASLTAIPQTGSGTNYSLKHTIAGQISNDLQAEAQRLSTIYSNFKTLEIKSYISAAGTGIQPTMLGSQVAGAPAKVKRFEHPVSPVPTLYWMGDPFTQDTWYRLSTKLNVYDANNNFIDTNATYDDACLYEVVYVKLESGGNFNAGLRAAGPELVVSDGTSIINSETITTANSGGTGGGGSQVVIGNTGIRVAVPVEISRNGEGREIVVTEDDIRKAKKKVKKGWRFWKKKKE